MSKRVMIILAVGFVCIIAAFFVNSYELKQDPQETDNEPEEEETEETSKQNEPTIQKETTAADASAGSDKTE